MCGIVVYYGDAENRLTRILSGMWAIIYRAPDSTGIGMLGSDTEPLKIRRELGSVENLIDRLMVEPLFDEGELRRVSVLDDDAGSHAAVIADRQEKLLAYEGLAVPANPSFPTWSDLTDDRAILAAAPGTRGNPALQEVLSIDSPRALKELINRLVMTFDLPLAVVEKLVEKGFREQVDQSAGQVPPPVAAAELTAEFKQIFNRFAYDEGPLRPKRGERKNTQKNPLARKAAWQLLRRVSVAVPPDFTIDGVANLFRHLDCRVVAGLCGEAADRIQMIFDNFRASGPGRPPQRWQSLYRAEKTCNVYGLAAASVMAWFQTEVYMKQAGAGDTPGYLPRGHVPGPTHPLLLRYMALPVIGQGRWAIQSAISVRNAHPFMDWKKERAVVLNGQFDSVVESRLADYLTRVAGFRLRTDNSTELFAMLWGYYFDTAYTENRRYKIIEEQHRLGLEDVSICSQSIDYTVFKNFSNKTIHDIDEMAFIRAVEAMIPSGGQFAVSGISRISPDRLFLAAHKRPVYVVRRRDTQDFMVVSDINAALGLFPQTLIQATRVALHKLMKAYSKKSVIVEPEFFNAGPDTDDDWFRREKMALLEPFLVDIFALDQARVFAEVRTTADAQGVKRTLTIKDFSGRRRTDIRPGQTFLTPVSFHKDFGRTFYEEHLTEIPGLISDALNRYTDAASGLPRMDIRRRILERRFGGGLANLNRILLVSTGFSYSLAEIVEKTMEQFFRGINIVAATPLDIRHVDAAVNPDRDLVVMISWSGTTSDMIDAATLLLKKNILMVGVTEKPFSDLALVVRKSAGVVPVMSGEEVTVAPLKSAACMLLGLDLFCLYICRLTRGGIDGIAGLTGEMKEFPEKLTSLLKDDGVAAFCRTVAKATGKAGRHYIVDAFHDVGTAGTGALNLELNAWTSVGNAVDYSDLEAFLATPVAEDDLILVTATTHWRLDEALRFMAALHKAGRRFFAVSFQNREQEEIRRYAHGVVNLPKVSDYFQPFIDLPFLFLLGFYYGLSHGRQAGEMPRNMAKSVTAGRTKSSTWGSAPEILRDMDDKRDALAAAPETLSDQTGPLCWISLAKDRREVRYYQDLLKVCEAFHEPDPFSAIFSDQGRSGTSGLNGLSRLLTRHLAEDGVLIFVPMDKPAEAACRNFIRLWEPFLNLPLQVEFPEKLRGASTEGSLVVAVASEPPDPDRMAAVSWNSHENLLWIGAGQYGTWFQPFTASWGAYFLSDQALSCGHEQMYIGLTLFFSKVLSSDFPGPSQRFNAHFRMLLPLVRATLGNATLRQRIQKAVQENKAYDKQLFVSSFKGNCISWKTGSPPLSPLGVESEPFGVSAYHHLVLVDPRAGEKFVAIEPRAAMLARYPGKDIRAWENRFLAGAEMDAFLRNISMPFHGDSVLPFIIDDQWYLPVLRPGYDTAQDCLVIIDATSETQFDAALDELATFGSRYARMVVIAQEGFAGDAKLANLKKYPLSHIILVPGLPGKAGSPVIISDYLLPVVVNLVGTAMKCLAVR